MVRIVVEFATSKLNYIQWIFLRKRKLRSMRAHEKNN